MNNFIKNASHYGDILAIPFFALLIMYFYNIEDKTPTEYVLLFFGVSGFLLDILYSYLFFYIYIVNIIYMSSRYSYKDMPIDILISNYWDGTVLNNYTPTIRYTGVSNSNGYGTSQYLPYNVFNVLPFSSQRNGNTGYGILETSPWSSGSSDNVNPGATTPTITIDLNYYVRNFDYSRLRCILVGGGGGGGGAGASNGRPTGGGGGSGGFIMFELSLTARHQSSSLTLSVGGAGDGGRGSARTGGGSGGGGVGQRGGVGGATSLTYYSGNSGGTSNVIAYGGDCGYSYWGGAGGNNSFSGNGLSIIYNFPGKAGSNGASGGTTGIGGTGPLFNQNYDRNLIGNQHILTFNPFDTTGDANIGRGRYMSVNTYDSYAQPSAAGGLGGGGGYNYNTNYGWGGGPGSCGYARVFFIMN
jgi:hypothetical protein